MVELEGKDLKASSSSFPSAAEGLLGPVPPLPLPPARRRNGHGNEEKAIGGQVGWDGMRGDGDMMDTRFVGELDRGKGVPMFR